MAKAIDQPSSGRIQDVREGKIYIPYGKDYLVIDSIKLPIQKIMVNAANNGLEWGAYNYDIEFGYLSMGIGIIFALDKGQVVNWGLFDEFQSKREQFLPESLRIKK